MTGTDSTEIDLTINGVPVSVTAVPPQTTLLDFLRSRGLTGAKEGCAEGECGACAVILVVAGAGGTAYRSVNSCLMFLPMAAGQEVFTVEALAERGQLAEVQSAIANTGGSQCGYCTPGFVMSLFAEQYRTDREGPCDPHELGGNLCRCTGYRPIRDAALAVGPPPQGKFLKRLARPAPSVEPMHYETAGVRFSRPASVDECISAITEDPKATLIAGGTDLGVESNLRSRRWPHLISVEGISELREFTESANSVRIGAGLTLTDIAERWRTAPPVFREWLKLFASPLIRNRATLGGNLATASPIGDGAPLLAALDAVVHVAGPNGQRTVPLASFFHAYRSTALQCGELLTAIEIPKPLPSFARFYKVAKRRMDDISTVAACMSLDFDMDGSIARARFAFGGVAPIPLRVTAAEDALLGEHWDESSVRRVQSIVGSTLRPISDHRGSAEYRLEVAKSLIEKFWWEWQHNP